MLNEHRIARVIWDTGLSQASAVHEWQNQLSRYSNQNLSELLNAVLDEFCGTSGYLQFEQIELDLGQIPADIFWQELPRRLRQQLQTWLQQWLVVAPAELKQQAHTGLPLVLQRELASLAWYLRYASYPWWHQQASATQLMQNCLQKQAQNLRSMLQELAQQSTVRWRLVLQFHAEFDAILNLLEPGQASWLLDYIQNLLELQQQYELLVMPRDEFKQKLCYVVLTQVICDRGSLFNQANFLQANLQLLAQQVGCSYAYLLATLWQVLAFVERRGKPTHRWFSTLHYLQQQQAAHFPARVEQGYTLSCSRRADTEQDSITWLGLQNAWQHLRARQKIGETEWQLAKLLVWATKTNAQRLAQVLRTGGDVDARSQFLIEQLTKPELVQLLPVLAPSDHVFIHVHIQQQSLMAREKNWQEESGWRVVLGYLLSSSASYFNRRQFVALSLHKTARRYAIDLGWLLNWMIASLQKLQPVAHRFELLIICRELFNSQRQQALSAQARENDGAATLVLPVTEAYQPVSHASAAYPAYSAEAVPVYLPSGTPSYVADRQSSPALLMGSPACVKPDVISETDRSLTPMTWRTINPASQQAILQRLIQQFKSQMRIVDATLAQQMQFYFGKLGKAQAHLIWQQQFSALGGEVTSWLADMRELAQAMRAQRQLYRYWRKHYPSLNQIKLSLTHLALNWPDDSRASNSQLSRLVMEKVCASLFADKPGSASQQALVQAQASQRGLRASPDFFLRLIGTPWYADLRAHLLLQDQFEKAEFNSGFIKARQSTGKTLPGLTLQKHPTILQTVRNSQKPKRIAINAALSQRNADLNWPGFFAHHPACRYLLNYAAHANASAMRRQLHYLPASLSWFDLLSAYCARRVGVGSRGRGAQHESNRQRWQHGGNAAAQGQCRAWYRNKSASLPRLVRYGSEASLFRALQFPAFSVHSPTRLTQLQRWLTTLTNRPASSAQAQNVLRETWLALALSYRHKTVSEVEFYRHLLRILAQDYAWDSHAFKQAYQQDSVWRQDKFWANVFDATPQANFKTGRILRAYASTRQVTLGLAAMPRRFTLEQDYQAAYLQHALCASVMQHYVEHGGLPPGLSNAGAWSMRRFWHDAIAQGYDLRGQLLRHCRFTEEKVQRISAFLNPQQVQKLLVTASGISREQARALQIWQHHLAHLGLAEHDSLRLQAHWQSYLLSAWWRGDKQAFSAERWLLSLQRFIQSLSVRQRLTIQTGLVRLSLSLPQTWRQALQLVLGQTPGLTRQQQEKSSANVKQLRQINPAQARQHGKQRFEQTPAQARLTSEETAMQERPIKPDLSAQQHADLSLPILIRNGGLVLLQSFYGALFHRLNYTDGEHFLSQEARQRAAMVLHYLSTGETQADEADLLLNKLLTGMTPTMNLPAAIELEQFEVDVCNSLLHSAIDYWSAIGRSTVDGFRGNWLIRHASISDAGDHWRLLVEKRAYDILLGRSPFSYSVVRLPWMEKAIYVTWPT